MDYVFRKKSTACFVSVVDIIGRVFFHLEKPVPPKAESIVVVRLDHLGDILGSTGIPQSLKGSHPSARILFLTTSAGKALLENNPYVDEIIVYDPPWFRRSGAGRGQGGFWKIVRELKKRRISIGLSLRGDARENLMLFLAGVRFRIGYGITGLGFLLNRQLTYREGVPEAHHSLDVLRALGIRREVLPPSLYFSEEEERRARSLGSEADGKKVVGIQFDAGSQAKTWPEANRSAFLEEVFQGLPGAQFLFLGSDPAMAAWLDKKLNGRPSVNMVGKTSLRELLVRLKSCHYFVGPDSGPAHMAAALEVPTLFLYSGTNQFEKWRPEAENADFLRNPVSCSPCHLTVCNVDGHPCMAGIPAERAVHWLKERLREE